VELLPVCGVYPTLCLTGRAQARLGKFRPVQLLPVCGVHPTLHLISRAQARAWR
jgi:hypothetical protein